MTPTTMTNGRMPAWMESAWMARYLDRQLTDEETATFEAYVLDKPELLAMLDADGELRDALAEGNASGAADPSIASRTTVSPLGSFARSDTAQTPSVKPAGSWVRAAWSVAAALLIGIGVGRSEFISSPAPRDNGIITSPDIYFVDEARGIAVAREKKSPNAGSAYVFIEVALPPKSEEATLQLGEGPKTKLVLANTTVSFVVARSSLGAAREISLRYRLNGQEILRKIDTSDLN